MGAATQPWCGWEAGGYLETWKETVRSARVNTQSRARAAASPYQLKVLWQSEFTQPGEQQDLLWRHGLKKDEKF